MKFRTKTILFTTLTTVVTTSMVASLMIPRSLQNSNTHNEQNLISQNLSSETTAINNDDIQARNYTITSPKYNDSWNPCKINGLNEFYAYQWAQDKQLAKNFIIEHGEEIFNGFVQDIEVVSYEQVDNFGNDSGSLIARIKFNKYWMGGSLQQSNPKFFNIKFEGFKTLSNSENRTTTFIESKYTTEERLKDKLSSEVCKEIQDALSEFNNATSENKAIAITNAQTTLEKYFNIGALPWFDNGFTIELCDVNSHNFDNILKLSFRLSKSFVNGVLVNAEVSMPPQTIEFDIKFAATTVISNSIMFNETGAKDEQDLTTNINTYFPSIRELIKSRVQMVYSLYSENNQVKKQPYLNSNDIVFKSITSSVGSNTIDLSVEINSWVEDSGIFKKRFLFKIYKDSQESSKFEFVQNLDYPLNLAPNDVFKKIKSDISNKSSFTEQVFIQSFISIAVGDPRDVRIIVFEYNEIPDSSNPNAHKYRFVFTASSKTTSITKKFTFEYIFYSQAFETTIPSSFTITNFDVLGRPVYFEGNSNYPVKYPYPNQAIDDKEFLRNVIYNNIINKPGPIDPVTGRVDSSGFTPNDIELSISKYATSENQGMMMPKITLKKFLYVNSEGKMCYESRGNKVFFSEIYGFRKAITDTTITLKPSFFDEYGSMKPSEIHRLISNANSKSNRQDLLNLAKKMISFNNFMLAENGEIQSEFDSWFLKTKNFKFTSSSPDDVKGTIRLNVGLARTFKNTGDLDVEPEIKDFPIFVNNLVANKSPTQISQDIYNKDSIFNNYYPTDIEYLIKYQGSTSEATSLIQKIKQNIFDNWTYFKPDGFTIDNISNITINSIGFNGNKDFGNGVNYTNAPYLSMNVTINKYISNNGNVSNQDKIFFVNLFADFKPMEDTRLITQQFGVPNVSTIKPSKWLETNNELALIQIVIDKFNNGRNSNPKIISGPYLGLYQNNALNSLYLKIMNTQVDDRAGEITLDVSLTKYWEVHNGTDHDSTNSSTPSIIENGNSYEPPTKIIFTGFQNKGITNLPKDNISIDISNIPMADNYPSYLKTSDSASDTNEFNTYNLRNFLLHGYGTEGDANYLVSPISGNKENITPNDLSIATYTYSKTVYNGTPDDINGELTITVKMNKMHYFGPDNTTILGPDINPQFPPQKSEFTVKLIGFKLKRQATIINQTIDVSQFPEFNDKVASELTETDLNKMFEQNGTTGEKPSNFNFQFDLTQADYQNKEGKIVVPVFISNVYNKANGLVNHDSNSYNIEFINIHPVEPTEFTTDKEITLTNEVPALVQQYPQFLGDIITNPESNNTLYENLRDYIYENLVTSGKYRLTKNDLKITSLDFNNKEGTLKIELSLAKYWNENCQFIDTTTNSSAEPKTKTIILKGLKRAEDYTHVVNNKLVNASNFEFGILYANKFQRLLQEDIEGTGEYNKQIVNYVRDIIFQQVISGWTDKIDKADLVIDSAELDSSLSSDLKVIVNFHLSKYWKDDAKYEFINKENSPAYKITFFGFNSSQSTDINQGPFDLASGNFSYDESDNKFGSSGPIIANDDIAHKTIQIWKQELQNEHSNIVRQLENFVKYNVNTVIINPVSNTLTKNDFSIDGIQEDNANGTIKFNLTLKKLKDNSGAWNETLPPITKEITIIGFLKPGETTFVNSSSIKISGELANYVISNNVSVDTVKLDSSKNIVTAPYIENDNIIPDSNKIDSMFKEFLFNNVVSGYKPLYGSGKLSSQDIVINKLSWTEKDTLTGDLLVNFSLKRWYDKDGNLQTNASSSSLLTKEITLKGFNPIQPPTPDATTIFKEGSFKIDNVGTTNNDFFVNVNNGKPKYDVRVFEVNNPNYKQAKSELENWVFHNLISGCKSGINVEDLRVNVVDKNIKDGIIQISYSLNSWWKDGIAQDTISPAKNATIYGFRKIVATSLEDLNDLRIIPPEEKYKLPTYEEDKENQIISAKEMQNIIETKTSDDICNDLNLKNNFLHYTKEFVLLNISKFIKNLPESYDNLTENEIIEKIASQITIDDPKSRNGNIVIRVNLYNYVGENGKEQGPITGPDDYSKPHISHRYELRGFWSEQPTSIVANNLVIDVSKKFVSIDSKGNTQGLLRTDYSAGNGYDWYNSEPANLIQDIVNQSGGLMNYNDAQKAFEEGIKQWLCLHDIINPLDNNESISITPYSNAKIDNAHGIISGIKFEVTHGYLEDKQTGQISPGQIPAGTMTGNIILTNMTPGQVEYDFNDTIIWSVIGGVTGGIIIIVIIILIITYRHRKDIEYNK